ncbi:MAG TPA: hypothetical protein VFU89_02035 [Rhabdochlamydiaceae bacterium]|nr:hypothetical protein [Rhabdochlamydiaceae bacterium]
MTFIARIPTPLFNTPNLPFNHLPLKKDSQGRLMEMEGIALPDTKFRCLDRITDHLLQVETNEYRSTASLYVDRRFLQPSSESAPERIKKLPSINQILSWMEDRVGLRYFWGGNWQAGIPELLDFYPVLKTASQEDRDDAICRGLDCSGLLYQATNGYTPRNTPDLIHFGRGISLEEIKPLDLLAWKGHVVIVKTPTTLIESRIGVGVVISSFEKRYPEILDLLKTQNRQLCIRRWHPDS